MVWDPSVELTPPCYMSESVHSIPETSTAEQEFTTKEASGELHQVTECQNS